MASSSDRDMGGEVLHGLEEFPNRFNRLERKWTPQTFFPSLEQRLNDASSCTHNAKFNGGPLSPEQVDLIQRCTDTFTLNVDLTDFKVLVGSPSNDEATGVVGYVGLLITADSLPEYNRAVAVYGGRPREGNIAHVSICGWELKGFSTSSEARAAFGLITADGEKYPDGQPFYTANVFPSMTSPEGPQ